jgi:hypothetical protein
MAITFPIDVPLEEFAEADFEKVDVVTLQRATFTGKDRVQEFDGDYWTVSLVYRNLSPEFGRPVSAFIASLRSAAGTFVVRFPGYGQPRGNARNTPVSPLVNGNGQAGNRTLNVKNATPSMQDWLLAGDIIQVGPDTRPHWHEVLQDVDTDGSGNAVIEVWPSLRSTTVNNDPIVLNEPRGLCRMTSSVRYPIEPPVLYDFTIQARESVP